MRPIVKTIALGFVGSALPIVAEPLLVRLRDALWGKAETPPALNAGPSASAPAVGAAAAAPAPPVLAGTARVTADKGALQDAAAAIANGMFGEFLGPARAAAAALQASSSAETRPPKTCCASCAKGLPCEGSHGTSGAGDEDDDDDDDDDNGEFATSGYDDLEFADIDGIGLLPIVSGAFNPLDFADPFGQNADKEKAEQKADTKAIKVRQERDAAKQAAAASKMEKKLDKVERALERKAAEAEKRDARRSAELKAQLAKLRTARPMFRSAPAAQQQAVASTATDKLISYLEKSLEQKNQQPAMMVAQPPWGAPPYGQPPYGQPPYGQPPYGQPPYGQPPYSASPWGAPPYGQPDAASAFPMADDGIDPWASLDDVAATATAGAPAAGCPWTAVGWSGGKMKKKTGAASRVSCACG